MVINTNYDYPILPWFFTMKNSKPGHLPMVFRPIGRQHVLVAPRKKRCSMSKWGKNVEEKDPYEHMEFLFSSYIYIDR